MLFHIKGVFRVCVGQVLVFRVLRDVEFIREERAHTSKLQDTFPAVHDRDFVLRHKLFAIMSSDEFKKGKKSSPLFEEGLNVTINCWVLSASHSFV